MRDQPLS